MKVAAVVLLVMVAAVLTPSTASGHTLSHRSAYRAVDGHLQEIGVSPYQESSNWSYLGSSLRGCFRRSRHAFRCRARVSYARSDPVAFVDCFFAMRGAYLGPRSYRIRSRVVTDADCYDS